MRSVTNDSGGLSRIDIPEKIFRGFLLTAPRKSWHKGFIETEHAKDNDMNRYEINARAARNDLTESHRFNPSKNRAESRRYIQARTRL